jgi:hypothetical protein
MSDRALRNERSGQVHAPLREPVRQSVRAYEQTAARVARPSRAAAREDTRGKDYRESMHLETPSDGYWFRQWVDAPDDGLEGDAWGTDALALGAGMEAGDIDAFVEQLSPRLSGAAHQALQMLLHLPRLGRVHVTASRNEDRGWKVSLAAEQDDTRERLSTGAVRCASALTERLGQPVSVTVRGTEFRS